MSSDSKAYIGGDPLPRPDISDRGERGTPIKPKAKVHKRAVAHPKRADPPASKPKTIDLGKLPQPKAPSYRAPDNYSTYGRPGTNDMGPSSPPKTKTINLGKLPSVPKSTPASKVSTAKPSRAPKTPNVPYIGGDPLPRPKAAKNIPYIGGDPLPRTDTSDQSDAPKGWKHAYKVNWS